MNKIAAGFAAAVYCLALLSFSGGTSLALEQGAYPTSPAAPAQVPPEVQAGQAVQPGAYESPNAAVQKSVYGMDANARPAHPHEPSPAKEELSQFERYISVKAVEITRTQLDIMQRFNRVEFSYKKDNLTAEKTSVAVKIVSEAEGGHVAGLVVEDAGYLLGTRDEISSAFETLGIKSPFTVSTDLRQFGYDLFSQAPSTFAPVEDVPVGPDYMLGPGDEVRISIWGVVNADYSVVIGRDGSASVPQMGVMHLAGLSFSEAKAQIEAEFSRYYRPSEVKINVGMGALRSIRVFVVGNAKNPGSYTVSSLSTVISALFAAGGPSKVGTMRDIQLKRNGETVARLDMYDFLLDGDKTSDSRLMPEDVIFVPPVGPLAGVAGNVKVPAIYELGDDTSLSGLIEMAGGANGFAYNNRVQVLHIEGGARRTLFELDYSAIKGGMAGDTPVGDGDLVTLFPVPQVVEKKVQVAGAVKAPGVFGFRPGMTLGQLLMYAGGLYRYADRETAELTRVDITPGGPVTERLVLNLDKAMAGDPANDIELMPDDYLFVRAVPEWELYRVVNVSGEVMHPGDYTIKKGETISSLIKRAGGYTDTSYIKGAVFSRESVRRSQQRNLEELVDRLEQQLLTASAQQIQTSVSPEAAQQEKVAAEQKHAFVEKLRSAKAMGRVSIRLGPLDKFTGSQYDIALEEGDSLYIPERPNHVQVLGSVFNQTAFVYDPDLDVEDYIDAGGGTTREADESEIYILKVDGTAVSRRGSPSFLNFQYDPTEHSWSTNRFMSRKLDPGDTVVVPAETEKVAWLRETKDITQILFQIAVATGVVIAAF